MVDSLKDDMTSEEMKATLMEVLDKHAKEKSKKIMLVVSLPNLLINCSITQVHWVMRYRRRTIKLHVVMEIFF